MRSRRLSGLQVVSNKSFSSSPQVGGKSWFRNMACADPQRTLSLPPNRLRVHGVSGESMAEEALAQRKVGREQDKSAAGICLTASALSQSG